MPMTNGAYISPQWRNGAPPALSAKECSETAEAAESAQYQVGDILFSDRSSEEMGENWLKCDGGDFDREKYAELGTLFPDGDNLPDIQKPYGTAYIRAKNGGEYEAPDFSTAKLSAENLNALSDCTEEWQIRDRDIVITVRNEIGNRFRRVDRESGANVFRKEG